MTSRRAAIVCLAAGFLAGARWRPGLAWAASPSPLRVTLGDVVIDFEAGEIIARGAAAADPHLPSPDVARPGAERRARASALVALRVVLPRLRLGPADPLSSIEVDRILGSARLDTREYQSNGGVILTLVVPFAAVAASRAGASEGAGRDPGDAGAPRTLPHPLVLAVPAAPLDILPCLEGADRPEAAGHGVRPGITFATYRTGRPPRHVGALAARRGPEGCLVLPPQARDEAWTGPVVIWIGRVFRAPVTHGPAPVERAPAPM